jgi:hypothetical protein
VNIVDSTRSALLELSRHGTDDQLPQRRERSWARRTLARARHLRRRMNTAAHLLDFASIGVYLSMLTGTSQPFDDARVHLVIMRRRA